MRPFTRSRLFVCLNIILGLGLLIFNTGCASLAHRVVSAPFAIARTVTRSPLLEVPMAVAEQGTHLAVDVADHVVR